MRKQHTLDLMAFMADTWLIEPNAGAVLLAQLANGGLVLSLDDEDDPLHYADYNWAYYPTSQKEGSTVILNISGVIYDYYVNYLCSKLDLIYADPNVAAMIVRGSGPGGSANAGNKLADKLLAAPFPTLAYVEYGPCASAQYMAYAACDQLYASRPNDKIGSIGTYITYQNWSKYFEKSGIVYKEIYAQQSSQKNEEGRQADAGNFELLEKMATEEAARFIDFVKARRPGIDTSSQDPFKGRLFSATDALSIGLIDGIGDLKSAVAAVRSSTNSNTTPRNTMLGLVKMKTLSEMKGQEAAAFTDEKLEAINNDLVAAGYKGIVVVSEAQYETAVAAINGGSADSAALTTAQADVTRLTTELATANGKVTTLEGQLTTEKEEVVRLGALNGAEKTTLNKGKDDVQADAGQADIFDTFASSLDHYKNIPDYLKNPVAAAQ